MMFIASCNSDKDHENKGVIRGVVRREACYGFVFRPINVRLGFICI